MSGLGIVATIVGSVTLLLIAFGAGCLLTATYMERRYVGDSPAGPVLAEDATAALAEDATTVLAVDPVRQAGERAIAAVVALQAARPAGPRHALPYTAEYPVLAVGGAR